MVSLVFVDILQLSHTVISNSEKLTHPIVQIVIVLSQISVQIKISFIQMKITLCVFCKKFLGNSHFNFNTKGWDKIII